MQSELNDKWGFSSLYTLLFFVVISVLSIVKQIGMHYGLVSGNHSVFILSVLLTFTILCAIGKNVKVWMLIPVAFIGFSCLQASIYPDQSWDGLAYHQKAAWYLMHGGNLLFDGDAGNYWVSLYPKLTWYFSGELGLQVGNLASGSSYQMMIGLGMYAYIIFFFKRNNYSLISAHLFAVFSLFSPIFIAQSFSYYVDAIVGFLALIMMLSSLEYGNKRLPFDAVIFVISSIIIVNIKFSGFLYVGVCFLILGVRGLPKIKETSVTCLLFLAFLVGGVGIIGANPYMKNIAQNKNIFYPLFGEEKKDIITFAQPISFSKMGRLEKLAISIFSESENINKASGKEPTLKVPGTVKIREIRQLGYEDLRLAGFGPLYSLCLLFSLAYLFYRKGINKNCLLLMCMIVLSTVLNPEAWWARYAPHLYFILLLPLLSIRKEESSERENIFIGTIIFLLVINAGLMAKARYDMSKSFNNGLNKILQGCTNDTLHLSPINNFLIEPLAQRSDESYVIDIVPKEGAISFNRKFYYWCQ